MQGKTCRLPQREKQDINLVAAQNTEQTTGKNSSKGGNVGIGIDSGGYGITVSAGINVGKGHENGSGLTHTETTLDACHKLTLNSGQDTILKKILIYGDYWPERQLTKDFDLVVGIFKEFFDTGNVLTELLN